MKNGSGTKEKPTILVVDDTPDNLTLISGILKDLYKVKVANSGERGLKIAQTDSPPDLILLDILMPAMDGHEVCKKLKSNPLTADIPVIFVTALTEIDDEKKGLELGAVDYIFKPISPAILLARINTHLNLKFAYDTLREKNNIIEEQIEMGRAVQELLLPRSIPQTKNTQIAYEYRPIQSLSGDFLDVKYDPENERLGFFICDVCGHGVASSIITAMVKISLIKWDESDPYGTLKKIQTNLQGKLGDYFITGIMGCLDLKTGMLTCVSAGHPPGIVFKENGTQILDRGGVMIADDIYGDFSSFQYQMEIGDTLLLYTDGIYDFQIHGTSTYWKLEEFLKMAEELSISDVKSIAQDLIHKIDQLNSGQTSWNDDVSLFVLQYL